MSSDPTAAGGSGAGEVVRVNGVRVDDAALAEALSRDLEKVEELINARIASGEEFLSDVALHLFRAGGKRFRPVVTLLCGRLFAEPEKAEPMIKAAAVGEMIHLATLYHDDVMDEAEIRRGADSANVRWDNSLAILAGDFLFAHSSMVLADLGTEAVGLFAQTFADLVTGQMRESMEADGMDPVDHHLRVLWEKTGSLIATAARFGGMFSAGASETQLDGLSRFGDALGIAFQIADDIIDIASAPSSSGKQPGTDLREGVKTLPILLELERDDCPPRLRELLAGPISDDAEVAEALALLRDSVGMRLARERLEDYVDRAIGELDGLPAGPANEALRNLTRFAVERTG